MIQDCSAGASKGFFESSVGAQFANRSESPKKAAPKQAAPTKASSGGGFFDSSVGSQFANRSESPKKAAPKQAAPTRASSSGKLFSLPMFHSQHVSRQPLPSSTAKRADTGLIVIVQENSLQAALL